MAASSSATYAARLSPHGHRGSLNLRPQPDHPFLLVHKCKLLARLLQSHAPVVLHTGAGISTAAGLRDFRGPDGVWTLEAAGAGGDGAGGDGAGGGDDDGADGDDDDDGGGGGGDDGKETSFEQAHPTLAHLLITWLHEQGYVDAVITQNVDGLHTRAGYPREKLSELHGCVFVEWCSKCKREYRRSFEIASVGFQKTGRFCETCEQELVDKALDWDDELPEWDLRKAREWSESAQLNVIIGTSCQMEPARKLPFRGKGKTILINLSETSFDAKCWLTLRACADEAFALVCRALMREPARARKRRKTDDGGTADDSLQARCGRVAAQVEGRARMTGGAMRGATDDVKSWFSKGQRRGYWRCVVCGQEVWCGKGKREGHVKLCVQRHVKQIVD